MAKNRPNGLSMAPDASLWLQSDLPKSSIPADIMTKLTEGNAKEHGTVTAIKVLVIMMRSRYDHIPSSVRQFVTHSFGTDITDAH